MQKQYKLKELRDRNNLTQSDVALELGISTRAYSNKENGISDFTLMEAKKIASLFNTNIYSIFFTDEVNIMNTSLVSPKVELESS